MTEVFLDTSHVVALANPRDAHHEQALSLARHLSATGTRIVTTEAILTEIGNARSAERSRAFAAWYIAAVERTPSFDVVYSSVELFHRGFELYETRPDKE